MIKRKKLYQAPLVMALLSGFVSAGCGNDSKHADRRSKDAEAALPFNPEEHYIVRGR
jgi:hypothetical protein